jgi:hypothetical protein
VNRVADLRVIYDGLIEKFREAEPSAAARVAAQIRLVGAELEQLERPEEVPFVDELAAKRSGSGVARPPARRRKSG